MVRTTIAISAIDRKVEVYGLNATQARGLVVHLERHDDVRSAVRRSDGSVRVTTIGRVEPTHRMVEEWLVNAEVRQRQAANDRRHGRQVLAT